MTDSTRCACDNCEWTGTIEEDEELRDFWSRVQPGDTVPAGDCPECGAFAFLCDEVAASASPESVSLTLTVNVFDPELLAAMAERLAGLSGTTAAEWQAFRADHPSGMSPAKVDLTECLLGNGEHSPFPVEAGFEIEATR